MRFREQGRCCRSGCSSRQRRPSARCNPCPRTLGRGVSYAAPGSPQRGIGRLTEGELLEGAVARLRVEGEDDEELKGDPGAVDGEVPPLDGVEGDGVDVVGEEATHLAEELLDTDAAAPLGVRPELDEVRWLSVRLSAPAEARLSK